MEVVLLQGLDTSVPSVEHAALSHCRGRRASPTAAPAPRLLQPHAAAGQQREGQCCAVGHYIPAAVNRKGVKRGGRSHAEGKYSFLLNIISFSIPIISIVTSWWKPRGPCYLQQCFSICFFLFETSRKKQSQVHGRCPVGSDPFLAEGWQDSAKRA